jgi:pilus assembly protein TadC
MSLREKLDLFGRALIFKKWREPTKEYLLKAGIDDVPYHLFGMLFIGVLVFTSLLYLGILVPAIQKYSPITQSLTTLLFYLVVAFALIAIIILTIYFWLNIRIYRRVNEMEQALPDYLQLVVTNLKSGMNFEQSLWSAARPEFGVLSKEIALVSKRVMTGNDTGEALMEFVDRYESPTLRRNFDLIISELQSGGEIVKVIERVITALRKTKNIKDELSASVLNFMIFIAVIVIVLSPALFALANTLLGVVISFSALIGQNVGTNIANMGSTGQFMTKIASLAQDGDHIKHVFRVFSYWAVGIIAFFSSLIVSVIEKGDLRGGLKYVPLFTVSALLVFTILSKILQGAFGSIFG